MSSYSISSARPKTSAGSRATSARGVRRPTTASRNVNERPLSRTSMTADGNLVQRAALEIALKEIANAMRIQGERVQSRAGTATQSTTSIVRPPTSGFSRNVAPPGSSMRPITQQGLSGVRAPPSRIGANRQILDTSYYISLLRQKSSELSSEIEMLRKELDRGERDQQNLMIYERRAEEEANTIRDLQGRLLDCNMIVDRLNTNWDLGELEEELNELQLRNDEAEKSLHELFADRQQSENEIEEIQKQIDSEKAKNGDIISDMDISVREQFEELKQEALRLNEDYSTKEQQLSELNQRKEELDEEMANSTLKQRASWRLSAV
ncbi:unnamed protein product [Anisakis simplex]|uniref:Intraflagellar transport protein 74 homolog (inferred by orthology to a human protein) n=1 Tax=Anisakis simplex TaxID=6269 RepID=A0A0M3JSW6_ANISI|nr:unnamed protein product [Anisakis simplex]